MSVSTFGEAVAHEAFWASRRRKLHPVEGDFPAVTGGTIRMNWDPGSRLAAITCTGHKRATGNAAALRKMGIEA
ncbi:hypothetical protein EPN29_05665 [bacterium]|nr:MAG: hypothetical protein EPN29_05665 [bacterium]